MCPIVRARAVNTLSKITKLKENRRESSVCKCCHSKETDSATTLTPELEKASNEGWKMVKSFAFPSLPSVLQDVWVSVELGVSIVAFILRMFGTFPILVNVLFQYTYLILNIVGMVLASIDAFVYFIESGSCVRVYKLLKKSAEVSEDNGDNFRRILCCNPAIKEKLYNFLEIGRTVLSELLLYPLLILDMFAFIVGKDYQPENGLDRADFGLFVISSFYLILAVYVMRMCVAIGAIVTILRLPKATGDSMNVSLMIKFCVHVLGQIFVHMIIVLIIGVKINNENIANNNTSMSTNDDNIDHIYKASIFLWLSIGLGWLLPLAGTVAFFIVNYYWLREFSISFWLNMLSLLQRASFADAVFGGDRTEDKVLEFIEESDYKIVKKQLVKYASPSWWTKFFYPARVPVAATCGILYDVCLLLFIGSLMLTFSDGKVQIVIFNGDDWMTVMFFIAVAVILLANIHIIFLLNTLLIILLSGLLIFCAIIASFILVLFCVYFPLIGLLGYCLLLKQLCSKSNTNDDTPEDYVVTNYMAENVLSDELSHDIV